MLVDEVTTLGRHLEAQHSVSQVTRMSTQQPVSSYSRASTAIGPRVPTLSPSSQAMSKSARRLLNMSLAPWTATSQRRKYQNELSPTPTRSFIELQLNGSSQLAMPKFGSGPRFGT